MLEIVILLIVNIIVIILLYSLCNLIGKLLKRKTLKVTKLLISVLASLIISSVCFFKIINSREYQICGEVINKKQTTKKMVALTLDDGPTREYTDIVLKILEEKNVKATFFLTGKELEKELNLGKQIVQAGHQVGNHSYSHERMIFKSLEFIKSEVEITNKQIKDIGYNEEIVFRCPYGKKFVLLPYYLEQVGMKNIMWDIEPESIPNIADNSDEIAKYVIDNAEYGSIILLHIMYKSREESRKALPKIIDGLRNKGYEFVTVSELLKS